MKRSGQLTSSVYIAEPSWLGEFIRPGWPGHISWRAGYIAVCAALIAVQAPQASAAPLSALLAGGFVDAGNARFHTWQLVSFDATGPPSPNLSLVSVLPLVDDLAQPGLQFVGNGQLATTGLNALDMVLKYQVTALTGGSSFTAHTLSMTAPTFGGSGGVAYISEEAVAASGADLGPNLAIADNQADTLQLADGGAFAPRLSLTATMNVFLSGHSGADAVTLSTFTVRYSQTGPALLSGDFDQDGAVDGADFLKWQRGQSPAPLSPADLAAWRMNFGQSLNAMPAISPVPEPSAAALFAALSITGACWLPRRGLGM